MRFKSIALIVYLIAGVAKAHADISPTTICSQPEAIKLYQKLVNERWDALRYENQSPATISVTGGMATNTPNVYKCVVIPKAVFLKEGLTAIFKFEMMDNGTFVVTDMTGSGW